MSDLPESLTTRLAEALYRWRWPDDPDFWQFGPDTMRGAVEAVEQVLLREGQPLSVTSTIDRSEWRGLWFPIDQDGSDD